MSGARLAKPPRLVVVLMAFIAVWLLPAIASAQVGISCNPDLVPSDPTCPGPDCVRVSGSCGPFGSLNWLCIADHRSRDVPLGGRSLCASICSDSVGLCRTDTTFCNSDFDCDPRESCLIGVCSVGGCVSDDDCTGNEACISNSCREPPPPPEPECTTDAQCGADAICLGEQCVLGDCRGDFECRTDEVCAQNKCTSRCPEGETWVPNPIGYPPIPLGRCQADETLVQCCYDDGNPLTPCPAGAGDCPVNFVCSTNNLCYSICGDGPCPGELPQRSRLIPPPDRWPDLVRPPLPGPGPDPRKESN